MNQTLTTVKHQNKMAQWAQRITDCRSSGMSVRSWCHENGIREQTYYKWQRVLFQQVKSQHESQFAEVTPTRLPTSGNVAVTLRIDGVDLQIHNGADTATLEAVLRAVKSC